MKILQIAPCYVDIFNETGGVSNIVRQICLRLEKEKINTVLICSNTELGKVVSEEKYIKYSDFLSIYIIPQYKNPLLGPVSNLLNILRSFDEISLIHIHTCFSAITDYSLNYSVKNNIPSLFTPHGKLSPSMFNNKKFWKSIYFNLVLIGILNKVSGIVTSSRNEINYLKSFGIQNKISYIYNGYQKVNISDLNISTFLSRKWELEPKSYLLFLGYLDPRKQPDLLIKAYLKSKAFEKFKLVIAGPDSYSYRAELENLIRSYKGNIMNKIIFTDRVVGADKWALLNGAKALVLPSKGEGWPVVIAEAIGAKIPVIISKECNFSEVTEMEIGTEVKDFSEESWSVALDEICYNDTLYKKFEESLEKYYSLFSWESITKQWIKKYFEILNETRAQ